jgi:hypothetical protein
VVQEVSFQRRAIATVGMFNVNCESLNRDLIKRGQALAQKLLAKMQADAQVCGFPSLKIY